MTLGVVGAPWKPIQQAAKPDSHTVEIIAVPREPRFMGGAATAQPGAGSLPPRTSSSEDVNEADDLWQADDYLTSDELDVLLVPPVRGRNDDGGLPGLLEHCPNPVGATPLKRIGRSEDDGFLPGLFDNAPPLGSDLPLFRARHPSKAPIEIVDREGTSRAEEQALEVPFEPDDDSLAEIELPIDAESDANLAEDAENSDEEHYLDRFDDNQETGWAPGVDLPDFDPDARLEPWRTPVEPDDLALRKARLKAASLASDLDLVTPAEIQQATAYLVALYTEAPHSATHAALRRLAREGLDLETLQAMVELRREWGRRSDWWLYRYRGVPFQHDGCRQHTSA